LDCEENKRFNCSTQLVWGQVIMHPEFEKTKARHSKTKFLKHPVLKMQDYLMTNYIKL
jgi:hypothetical protein